MASSNENNDELVKDLAKSLQVTSTLMQSLLSEMRDNATSLAVLKEKLETLRENVDNISYVINSTGGKDSLLTRLALVEQSLQTLDHSIEEYRKELDEEIKADKNAERKEDDFRRTQSLSKLKIAAVAIPGIISLVILILKMLSSSTP